MIVGIGFSSSAQLVDDSISMLPGYVNESYYSLANDEQANIDNTNWDLAFDLSGYGASIRTNEHTGTEVYVYPNGTDWASVDTTGMIWNAMHNSETSWFIGAVDQSVNTANPFDLGWGIYNPVTHHINGDSINIIKLSSGGYKKVMFESLISGVYTFKHADLDGSNEVSATVTKGDFTDKNFAYYSIVNDITIDREPANNTWDIVFTKYIAELGPGVHYGVTGVLANNGVYVREASGIDPTTAAYTDYMIDSVINVIGWDWKSFNMSSFAYDIVPDLSYFVQDQAGDIWHLIFSKFEGTSTGKVVFGKELVSSASIDEVNDITALGVYPNPAKDQATIVLNSTAESIELSIVDLSGKQVFNDVINETGFITYPISTNNFLSGTYFIQVRTKNGLTSQKLVVI